MEADQLSSLAQVESRAMTELGLIRPATRQIIRLEFEESDGRLAGFPLGPIVPDATAGCRCSYLNKAWFALGRETGEVPEVAVEED